ncbi:sulfite exporter TauE/SafE family protein (plasmid) [Natrinema zhouii]|uniref:sulfite exporter TauE/SafE family protein n=1 Tax=Natrinema zhouii TaxID=1710539 RepID=UPI001D0014CD|nr:sulfite exporter TauE/SafE family protein [Natrinema zhouii]UHQ99015.1 sulfite exporter TauE/SafE family protein [Natrinema zhouii]
MDLFTSLGVDVLLFLAIGVLAGAHCIGMCGPLVTVYASQMDSATSNSSRESHLTTYEVRQHALFNIGRTASYTLLGAVFGALGSTLFVTTASLSSVVEFVRGGIGLIIGGLVMVVGVYYLLGRTTGGIHLPGLERISGWLAARVDRLANGPGIVGLGAVHGLLPCPILYPAFLYAFAIGSPAGGAVALGALGLGTIPAVFAYGTVIDAIDVVHRQRVHRLLGVAFVALGYILLAHGLMSLGIHLPHPRLPFYDGIEVANRTN